MTWLEMFCRDAQRLTDRGRRLWRKVFSYKRKRFWYWTAMHCWSILRLRRPVVFALVALGFIVALVITLRTTPVFSGVAQLKLILDDSRYASY